MSEILLCQTPDREAQVEVNLDGETVSLSQKQMAELFDKGGPTINFYISSIFRKGEPEEEATFENLE